MGSQQPPRWSPRVAARAVGIWAAVGLAVALLGVLAHPQYLPLCDALNGDNIHLECAPITTATMAGYFVVFFGIVATILGPIVLALRAESKSVGRSSSRSWRAENWGLLAGLAYLAAGILLLVLTD